MRDSHEMSVLKFQLEKAAEWAPTLEQHAPSETWQMEEWEPSTHLCINGEVWEGLRLTEAAGFMLRCPPSAPCASVLAGFRV